jgi:hypothetical protein
MSGSLIAETLVTTPLGTFGGIAYSNYEAMFQGTASQNHPYRVPCQIVAPTQPAQSSRLLLFDWLNTAVIATAIGRDFGLGRYVMTDDFLFGQGLVYAAVRSDPVALGKPWMDGTFDTSGETIKSAHDNFDIVADFIKALVSDPLAVKLAGPIKRKGAFGYSHSGAAVRYFLRADIGQGMFDFSLPGGCGAGTAFGEDASPPPATSGRSMEFNTESEVIVANAARVRADAANLRVYEFAGCAHARRQDAILMQLPDADKANPADWFCFARTLFVAANKWCDGAEPPSSIWLGAPRDNQIARDGKGNALVRYVAGKPITTDRFRLPEVAVGENQYIAYDKSYANTNDLRAILGGFVDLSATFTDHAAFVGQITDQVRTLQDQRYLLKADADALIQTAAASSIGT